MRIKHKTSKHHYEKYAQMAKDAGVTLLNTRNFLGYNHMKCNQSLAGHVGCGRCWGCMYIQDNALNSVPLRQFDMLVERFQLYHRHRVIKSLGDGVCMYKHLVIFEILGAEPEFTD